MLYNELIIGEETYKLKLDTKNMVNLERALGKSPLSILIDMENGKMPSTFEIITILHYCLQSMEHGINSDATYKIADKYVEQGHTLFDLIPEFVKVFQNCGYISNEEDDEKN